MDLLRGIGGDEFILQENQGKVIIRDKDVKAFTKFLQQLPQEAAEIFGKELQKLKSADLNLKAIIAQKNALSYGLQIHNPISLPEGYDTATFNPTRDIEYFSGLYDLEEQENISQLSQLYHANREFYQILIGSYARALLDNEIFMQYASDRLHTTLHHLRAGRGYLGHNTEPNLGKGEDIKTHSSNVAYSLILELLNIMPELLTLRLVLTDEEVEFTSSIEDFSSQYHAQITDEEVNKLLQMLLDKETDLQVPKRTSFSNEWLTGDQIAGIGDIISDITFIPSIDAHLDSVAHGAIEPMIRDNPTNTITAAINVSPNTNVNSGKGNHWIFYFVTQGADGIMHGVLLNPMGNHLYDLTIQRIQERMVTEYGGPDRAHIEIHNLGVQTDGYNCGVWVLWFLEQINQLQQQGILIDKEFVKNLPVTLQKLSIVDINAKRAEYKAMLDVSNESQNTASCSEEGKSMDKDKEDDEDDGDYGVNGAKYGIEQRSLNLQTTSATEKSKTSSNNYDKSSDTTTKQAATIIWTTPTLDEKISNQLDYYLEHGVMFDTLRQTMNQNEINVSPIPGQYLHNYPSTYVNAVLTMLTFCSLSLSSNYRSIHKSGYDDSNANALTYVLGLGKLVYDSYDTKAIDNSIITELVETIF